MLTKLQTFVARYHLLWVLLYVVIFTGAYVFAKDLYTEYDKDRLPRGYIELVVNKTEYQLGETVEFTVINHFPTTVYVTNHCPNEPLNVYRWEHDTWIQLHDTATDEESSCYAQERNVAIASEGSRTYNFADWPNLFKEPGVYRIAMHVDHYADVPFQDFVVLQPAEVQEVIQEVVRPRKPEPVVVIPAPVVIEEVAEEEDETKDKEYEEYEREEERENEHEHEDEEEDDD